MHRPRSRGVLVGLTLLGLYEWPRQTVMLLAALAGLYLVIGLEDYIQLWYHTRRTATTTEDETRRYISHLLMQEQTRFAHYLYATRLSDAWRPAETLGILRVKLGIALSLIVSGVVFVNGVSALTGPFHETVFAVLALVVVVGGVLGVGHVIWFRLRESRQSRTTYPIIEANLDQLYDHPQSESDDAS